MWCNMASKPMGRSATAATIVTVRAGIVKLTPKIARLYSKERTIEGFGLSRAPVFSPFPALQLSSRERCLRRFFINLTMPLLAMSARRACEGAFWTRTGPMPPSSDGRAWGSRSTCCYPGGRWGSPKAGTGRSATRPLQHSVCVLHCEHGKLPEGCEGEWEVGKGDPNEPPMPREVADGA